MVRHDPFFIFSVWLKFQYLFVALGRNVVHTKRIGIEAFPLKLTFSEIDFRQRSFKCPTILRKC